MSFLTGMLRSQSMKWNLLTTQVPQTLAELKQVLLTSRQIEDQAAFFHPKHPNQLTLVEVGIKPESVSVMIDRIKKARETQEEILVFGDYDVDGISATAVMWQTLHALGCHVKPFVPHREKHGYGLSQRALDDILAASTVPTLLITVDNGIVAHEPANRLQEAGIDLIITDHHLPEATLPPALAIVHTTKLCGTTVAWMAARELAAALGGTVDNKPATVNSALDLCGLATIADQVPLQGANRSFAYHGVEALRSTTRVGMLELMELAALIQKNLTVSDLNFGLAPRINAMGRLEHGLDALRLLCTTQRAKAHELAGILQTTNLRRQDLTYDMVEQAKQSAHLWENEHLIIVHSAEYHDGVIGLIAGRLMEEYYKPAIAMSITGDIVKASARSIHGVNIVDIIREVRHDLLEVGGHPMAAGFGLETKNMDKVITQLLKLAKEKIAAEMLVPKVDVEAILPTELITEELVDLLAEFEPFGQGNPRPIFGVSQVQVLDAFAMGRDNRHLKLVVGGAMSARGVTPLYAVGWNLGQLVSTLKAGDLIDLAGTIELNEYKGRKSVQLKIKDVVSDKVF